MLPVGNDILLGQKVGKDAEKKGEMVQMAIRQSFRRPELEGLEPLCKHTPWWPRPPAHSGAASGQGTREAQTTMTAVC